VQLHSLHASDSTVILESCTQATLTVATVALKHSCTSIVDEVLELIRHTNCYGYNRLDALDAALNVSLADSVAAAQRDAAAAAAAAATTAAESPVDGTANTDTTNSSSTSISAGSIYMNGPLTQLQLGELALVLRLSRVAHLPRAARLAALQVLEAAEPGRLDTSTDCRL
jgi:hypothetical protein